MITVNPQIKDVVIWNDPNDQAFWAPQYNADGSSAAPPTTRRCSPLLGRGPRGPPT